MSSVQCTCMMNIHSYFAPNKILVVQLYSYNLNYKIAWRPRERHEKEQGCHIIQKAERIKPKGIGKCYRTKPDGCVYWYRHRKNTEKQTWQKHFHNLLSQDLCLLGGFYLLTSFFILRRKKEAIRRGWWWKPFTWYHAWTIKII